MSSGDDVRELFERAEASPFTEPWQAQAFAMTVALHQAGTFTWERWAETFSARLAAAGPDDSADRYWEHWLANLESLSIECGVTDGAEVGEVDSAWRRAFEDPPHGAPVSLDPEILDRLRSGR